MSIFEETKKIILNIQLSTEKEILELIKEHKKTNIKSNIGKIIDTCISKLKNDNYLKDYETLNNYLSSSKEEIMSNKKIGIRLSISNIENIDNLVIEAKNQGIKLNRTKLILNILFSLKEKKVFSNSTNLKEFLENRKLF